MNHLTVDIGTVSVKIAEFSPGGELKNYVVLSRPKKPFYSSVVGLNVSDVVPVLKRGLEKLGSSWKNAVVSVPAFLAFTSVVSKPDQEPVDARKYVPAPLSSVTAAWFEIEPAKGFLIAVPTEHLENYQKIFRELGVGISAFELESLSLARLFTSGRQDNVLIVDVGGRSTHFSVAHNGIVKFVSHTDFASSSIFEHPELNHIIQNVIISEGQRTVKNFTKIYHQNISKIILCGGGARNQELAENFEKRLGLAVKVVSEFDPALAVAIGLHAK